MSGSLLHVYIWGCETMKRGLWRPILVIQIVMLIFGASWMVIFSGHVSSVAAQATIYVNVDNTGGPWDGSLAHPYQNITTGLAYASDGDTVYVFGGTYSENVVLNKSVTLTGESKPVIDGMSGSYGINITVNNAIVQGFNITNSYYGIYCNASGFSIVNNVFWNDSYGFYWNISESSPAEDYTVYASMVKNNEFYMSTNNDAVYVCVALGYNRTIGYDVNIEDITVCSNTFYMDGTTATGIRIYTISVYYLYGGTVSFGVLNMSENIMYGGEYGIRFYGELYELQDVQANVGDVIIKNNVMVNQSSIGTKVDYYDGTYWYGNTVGTYGDLIITGNKITSVYPADGIQLRDIGYWYEFYGNASLEVGNVYIEENEIDVGEEGIYFYGYEVGKNMSDNSLFSMGHIFVKNNTIVNGYYGIYVEFEHFGYNLYDNSSFSMGNIEFSGNMINSTKDGIYISYLIEFGYEMYDNASFVMGDILLKNNNMTSGNRGINIDEMDDFGTYMYGNSSFTMGNIEFSGNLINSTNGGIYIYDLYEFGYEMYDKSSFTMESILANDNIINSGSEGIHVEYVKYFGTYMHDNSSFTMGNIELSGNVINSTYYGIYTLELAFAFGYEMEGTSSFTMQDILVNNNSVNSGDDGIYVEYIQDFGNSMYGNSSFAMRNIEVSGNTINSTNYGMLFYEIDYFGYEMHNESSFTMGDFLVNDNIINSDNDGIYHGGIASFGYDMHGNSSFTMGNVQINGNVINSTQRGMSTGWLYEFLYEFGSYLYGNSSFTMGNIEFSGNVINSGDDAIHLFYYIEPFGITVYDNASFTMGNIEFDGNLASNSDAGMNFTDLENAIIRNNILQNSSYGIYLQNSANNSIYHNNFINNTVQAYVTVNYTNTWDDGYPSGGNYWSDYNGTDLYSGPDQNIGGSDFRGDTPRVIDANNTDHYPLMIPYETEPPTITILSPENKTYSVDTVSLTFTVDETTTWMGYSLDGQANVTITGNTTLPVLSDGSHYVVVYANDTFDNMGSSTVYFAIDTTPPSISILSPENKTYDTTDLPLNFTVDEPVSWMAYSLDGQANVTITGNVTLSGLSEGSHNITVYAEDAAGNTGASPTIYFTIETPPPSEAFPIWIVVTIAIIVIAALTLLVYFTKIRKRTEAK